MISNKKINVNKLSDKRRKERKIKKMVIYEFG